VQLYVKPLVLSSLFHIRQIPKVLLADPERPVRVPNLRKENS
jgi:hypothetical protein